jgi:hypothetical protein
VYKFLKQQGGAEQRLGEDVVVPLVLEPFMQALQYIHEKVRCWGGPAAEEINNSWLGSTSSAAFTAKLLPAHHCSTSLP